MDNTKKVTDFHDNESALLAHKLCTESQESVHLSGISGTGKTALTNVIANDLRASGKNVEILALTNLYAKEVGGKRIHQFLQTDYQTLMSSASTLDIHYSEEDLAYYNSIDFIIIHHIGVLPKEVLDKIDYLLRNIRKSKCSQYYYLPFGGLQMLFVGDHFIDQTFPLFDKDGKRVGGSHFSRSEVFTNPNFQPQFITLKKCYANFDPEHLECIRGTRVRSTIDKWKDIILEITKKNGREDLKRILLTIKKDEATEINTKMLMAFFAKRTYDTSLSYKGIRDAKKKIIEEIERCADFTSGLVSCSTVFNESQIIFTEDDPDGTYRKGDVGFFNPKKFKVVVELNTGQIITIKNSTMLSRSARPIRMCWAIGVYHSHGMRLEQIKFELSKGCWLEGQAHKALARCRSLDGLLFSRNLTKRDFYLADVYQFEEMIQSDRHTARLQVALAEINCSL